MRKIIVIILSFCLLTLNVKAEELSTLLLHDGNHTQFMGSSSFKKAYDTAVEGDTIIFSPGNFTEGPGDVLPKIKKNNLHLIGSGAFDSALRTNLYTLEIEAEGVTVENVVSTLTVYGSHSRLIGCYLNVLSYTSNILYNGGKVPEDNVVSQCVIEKMMSVQNYDVQDLILKNCTIKEFFNSFLTNKNGKNMYLTNCVIYSAAWLPSANYTNNIIYAGGNPEFRTPSVFTNNLFYAETEPTLNFGGCTHTDDMVSTFQKVFGGEENYPATPINVPNGNDGKPVGIYGGEGFQKESPVPAAKSYNVSTVTSFLGNVSMAIKTTGNIDIPLPSAITHHPSSIKLCISVVPMWPVAYDRSNKIAVSVDGGKAVICENVFKEWGPEWKLQVLENRKEFVVTLPLDKNRNNHVLTLSIVDPGQIIQKITYE